MYCTESAHVERDFEAQDVESDSEKAQAIRKG